MIYDLLFGHNSQNRVQRYNKNCIYANILAKKAIIFAYIEKK